MHLSLAAGLCVVVLGVTTVVQGLKTERWEKFNLDPDLDRMAERVRKVPLACGDWEGEVSPVSEEMAAQYRKARVKEHIDVSYRNSKTGKVMRVTLVCGHFRHVAKHTPDQCMPAAGFTYNEQWKQIDIAMADGTEAQVKTAQFVKQGENTSNQRMIWAWTNEKLGDDKERKWIAPRHERWGLSDHALWYKLYITLPLPGVTVVEDRSDIEDFVKDFLPELNKVLHAPTESEPPAKAAAA